MARGIRPSHFYS